MPQVSWQHFNGVVPCNQRGETSQLAGTRTFLAITGIDDADGYPLECERDSFTTRKAAQRWATDQLARQVGGAFFANVHESLYQAEEYVDRTYGHILDAYAVELSTQYGWRDDDGRTVWDDPEPT